MENKEKVMLKMKRMSIEEKIAMLSDKDEAYVRGFIEGTLFWSCQMAQKKRQSCGQGGGRDKGKVKICKNRLKD